jgi:osmotically inducible lipoprotein OsmB
MVTPGAPTARRATSAAIEKLPAIGHFRLGTSPLASRFESRHVGSMEDLMTFRHVRNITTAIGIVAAFGLAACGETKQDRALSGAALGAGAGAATGAATGGSVLGGAALGGAAGGAGGYFTNKNQIELGKPIWKR